jgi:hypothetical protein
VDKNALKDINDYWKMRYWRFVSTFSKVCRDAARRRKTRKNFFVIKKCNHPISFETFEEFWLQLSTSL